MAKKVDGMDGKWAREIVQGPSAPRESSLGVIRGRSSHITRDRVIYHDCVLLRKKARFSQVLTTL
jgi:hypothetical protein